MRLLATEPRVEEPISNVPTSKLQSQLNKLDSIKPLNTAIPIIQAVFVAILFLAHSDINKFFWTLVGVTVVFFCIAVFLVVKKTPSVLAPEQKVPIGSKGVRYASVLLFLGSLAATLGIAGWYHNSLFDPILTSIGDSLIRVDSPDARIIVTTYRMVSPSKGAFEKIAFLASENGNRKQDALPYTFVLTLRKPSRFDSITVDGVSIRVLSFSPVPADIELEVAQQTRFQPAAEFNVTVKRDAIESQPRTYEAFLLGTDKAISKRGRIELAGASAETLVLNVSFEEEGIWEITPELIVNEGWRQRSWHPADKIKVLSMKWPKGLHAEMPGEPLAPGVFHDGIAPPPRPRDMPPPPKPPM
jgi:hypothetical protein